MTPEEREWDANREARFQWTIRRLNESWRELQTGGTRRGASPIRRRLFPWRIRIDRVD